MQPWEAEHGVDEARARELVAATWPDLATETPSHVGSGWDIDVWRFGALAVRFPRRAFGVSCLENELRVLPAVAERATLPVPRPERVGEPVLGFPSRFYAHPWLPGIPVLRASLGDAALETLAAPLGEFLRALHATPLEPLRAAGLADDGRGDVARVAERGLGWLAKVTIAPALSEAVRALLAAPSPPTDSAPKLIHGDCHGGNLLVDRGQISGVIDWGDCAAGDPAVDLALGWSLVPAAARPVFLAAYGEVSPATWARAQINAASRHGVALLAWGQGLRDAAIIEWATQALERVTSP